MKNEGHNESSPVSIRKTGGMARARHVLMRAVGVSAVLCVAGYVGLHLAVRTAVRTVAAKAGIANLVFEVRTVSLSRVTLGGISLPADGNSGPTLASAEAEFSLRELLSGKLKKVVLSGLTVTVDATDLNNVSLIGVKLPASSPASSKDTSAHNTSSPSVSADVLPSEIVVSNALVHIKLASGEVTVPLSLNYSQKKAGSPIEALAALGPDELRLKVFPSVASWTGEVSGTLTAGTILPLLPAGTLPDGLTADGRADVYASFDLAGKSAAFRLGINEASARIPTAIEVVDLTKINVDITGHYSPDAGVSAKSTVSAVAKALYLDGPTRVLIRSDLSGTTLKGSVVISGPALIADIPTYSLSTVTRSGQATVNLSITPPGLILQQLRNSGITIEKALPLLAQGTVSYTSTGSNGAGLITAELTQISAQATSLTLSNDTTITRPALAITQASLSLDTSGSYDLQASGLEAVASSITGLPDTKVSLSNQLKITLGTLTGRGNKAGYQITSPDITLVLPPTNVTRKEAQLAGTTGVLHMSATASPEAIEVRLMNNSTLQLASAKAPDGSWETGSATFTLTERTPRPTTQSTTQDTRQDTNTTLPTTRPALPLVRFANGHTDLAVRAEARGVTAKSRGADVLAGRLVTNIELGLGETTTLGGYVRVEQTDITHEPLQLSLKGLTVSLPFSLDAEKPPSGTFTVASVERSGKTFPGLTGDMWITRRAAYAGVTWELLKDAPVKASAEVQFLPDKTLMDIRTWIPEFDIRESSEIRKLLPAGLSDLDVTGKFSAELRYYVDGDTVSRWGEIDVKNATIKSTAIDANLSGVNGHVWTRSFSPLETSPGQTLSIANAKLGNLNVSNGNVAFRIDGGNLLFIESASFNFLGGQVEARGFRIDPIAQAADLVLYADNIDIGQLTQTLSPDKISGTGKLYARLPASVKWPERVSLSENTYIYAAATGPSTRPSDPNGAGTINLGPYSQTIASWAGVSLTDPPAQPSINPKDLQTEVRRRIVEALSDFGFTNLSLTLTRTAPDQPLKASLRTNGQGASASDNQSLNIEFNFSGFEPVINLYLGFNKSLDKFGK